MANRSSRPTRRELWNTHLFYASAQDDQEKLQRAVDELGLKAPRQQKATKPRAEREGGIQDAILKALKLHPRVAWAVHLKSGAYQVGERYIQYGVKGAPDIIGQLRPSGKFLGLEVKQPGQNAKEHQQAFLDMIREAGGVSGVVRSVDDAIRVLSEQGAWRE